ncbi:potassium transporter [Guyanagaster necrorhizus]|uniref:Potassium transporter n=1 Tax=Guyanagaster necrorhizus TaxID=856835 RepID=A0A9P7VIB9_9AGAR|nr:potassium transporter [Guyanagaster necrorhizus MCA 3950]KAG7440895.1 potassium transporter [Guyanagaster necrorhizus MCA 3950]
MVMPSALETGLRQKRTAVHLKGFALLQLSFQTLGIIYSDIGTSPLYVLNGIWPSTGEVPSKEDIIGGISAIIWSITILPLVKYVFTSLRFATQEGEGGSFALYQGLYPPKEKDYDADRTLTGDYGRELMRMSPSPVKATMKEKLRWPLLLWCLFGTALTMADGMFTPAVSVTSAVGGIAVAKSSVTNNIIPIAIAFLLALFFVQQFGTARLAVTFGPISCIWFLLLAGTGIYNITLYPGILRAFDPSRGVLLFVRTKNYDILAGVLLAITGCEAIFANVGQFNALSIQISFACFVYPALLLAYLGQGAALITDGEQVIQNVFYRSIPGGLNGPLFWIMFTFAILATIIASQAMITATFSLLQQIISMKSFPPLRLVYTSETIQGRVYIPAINWTLMIGTIILVATFSDLAKLTNAYGFAVATVMFSTTILLSFQIHYVKKLPVVIALLYFVFFGFFDGLFWGASLKKIPHGAWVPLTIGICIAILMWLWTWGKGLEDAFDGQNRQNLKDFIHKDEKSQVTFHLDGDAKNDAAEDEDDGEDDGDTITRYYCVSHPSETTSSAVDIEQRELVRIPTCAVFHKIAEGQGVPHTFIGLIRQWPGLPEVLIFLSVSVLPVPRVPVGERYIISRVRSIEGFYGATYYIGYRDNFDVKIDDLLERICALEAHADPQNCGRIIKRIKEVAGNTTHIVPHYYVVSRHVDVGKFSVIVNFLRRYLIEEIYRRLATMFPETANWLTSADEIIHVGINAPI